VVVASQLAEDDQLAASLACRKLREAVAATEWRKVGLQRRRLRRRRVRLLTTIASVFGVVGKLKWYMLSWHRVNWTKVEWAVSCGMPLNRKLLYLAAQHGDLERLRWLRSHGCAWDFSRRRRKREDPCSNAAAGGHLSVLQWARADGCPWDARTCAAAAGGGHLAVLQ
jgi:hypothetical protein